MATFARMLIRGAPGVRRVPGMFADALLFGYLASWLFIGAFAFASPAIGGPAAAMSYAATLLAFALAVVLRLRAADREAVRAVARVTALFGAVSLTSGMGSPLAIFDAAATMSSAVATAAAAGGAVALLVDAAFLWLPLQPHWLLFAGVLHLTAVFPAVHRTEPRWRKTLAQPALIWAIGIVATVAWLLIDLLLPPAWSRSALWISTLAILPIALLTAANLRSGYRAAAPRERGRVLGIVAAVVVCVLGEMLYHVTAAITAGRPPAIVAAAHLAAPLIAILLAAYSVFVRGGLSPQLVVRRTALYGALGVAGIFIVALLDQLLSSLLVTQLGVSEGFVSSVMLAAVAVLLKPVHDRLSVWLTRTIAHRMPETAGDDALSSSDEAISVPGADQLPLQGTTT